MNWKFDFSPETSDIFAVLAVPYIVGRKVAGEVSPAARCCKVRMEEPDFGSLGVVCGSRLQRAIPRLEHELHSRRLKSGAWFDGITC